MDQRSGGDIKAAGGQGGEREVSVMGVGHMTCVRPSWREKCEQCRQVHKAEVGGEM